MHSPYPKCVPGAATAVLTLGLFASGPAHAAAAFPFAAGRVTYEMKIAAMRGINTLSWIDRGRKVRQDCQVTHGRQGQAMNMRMWSFTDGKSLYTHNPAIGPAVLRMKLPKEALAASPSGLLFLTPGQKAGKVVGQGTVLGKPCEIREMQGLRMWLWKGVPLKMEAIGPSGPTSIIATKLEVPVHVAGTQFKVPSGYQVRDFSLANPAPSSSSLAKARTR